VGKCICTCKWGGTLPGGGILRQTCVLDTHYLCAALCSLRWSENGCTFDGSHLAKSEIYKLCVRAACVRMYGVEHGYTCIMLSTSRNHVRTRQVSPVMVTYGFFTKTGPIFNMTIISALDDRKLQ